MRQLARDSQWNLDLTVAVGQVTDIVPGRDQFAAERLRHFYLRGKVDIPIEIEPAVAENRIVSRANYNIVRDDTGTEDRERQTRLLDIGIGRLEQFGMI